MDNLPTIKFSHRYLKMPHGVEYLDTWLVKLRVIDFSELTQEQIEQDTAIVGGGNYELPKGKLLWLGLYSDALPEPKAWQTIRRWTPEKEAYYRGLLGKQVSIKIATETPKGI